VFSLIKAVAGRLTKLPFYRDRLHAMIWYYVRDRKPNMSNREKLFLSMGSIWAAFQPVNQVDPRYLAARATIAHAAIRQVAEDYDAAGVIARGTFNLLEDPDMKALNVELAEAERLLREAIEDNPDFAEAHFALAALLLDRGERHSALVQYLLAASGRAQILGNAGARAINAEAYHEASVLLQQAKLLPQAEYCERRAIEADDALPRAQLALARTLAAHGQLAQAAHHMSVLLSGQEL
jgi:tetratricopeptide (TPR) repeat protein